MKDTYFGEIKVRAYTAADRTNGCADSKDVLRNHTNYGECTAWVRVMIDMGHKVNLPVWEDDNGCLRIPFLEIDGEKWIEFQNGK